MIRKASNYLLLTPILLTIILLIIVNIFSSELGSSFKIILCIIVVVSFLSNYIMVYIAMEYMRKDKYYGDKINECKRK